MSATTTFAAPAGLSDENESPMRDLPDVPLWSENFWFGAWDEKAGLGVWTHLGRIPDDPSLWRELVMLYLPDGTLIQGKQYGRGEHDSGPGSATLSYAREELWNGWRVRFDGALAGTTFAQLHRGPFTDSPYVPVSFDLAWRPICPIWNMGKGLEHQSWGDIHYEQLGGLSGRVHYGNAEVDFKGVGLRDHTRGARSWRPFLRHCWLHGVFGEDRGFMIANMELDDDDFRRAAIWADGKLEEAVLEQSPLLENRDAEANQRYTIGFEGHPVIEAEILHNSAMGFYGDNDVLFGFDSDVASHANFEGFTRFTWDGHVGFGLSERSLRA